MFVVHRDSAGWLPALAAGKEQKEKAPATSPLRREPNPNPGNPPGFQQNTQPIDARILSVAWLEGKPALGMGLATGTEHNE